MSDAALEIEQLRVQLMRAEDLADSRLRMIVDLRHERDVLAKRVQELQWRLGCGED